jgi:hypothetical protein
MRRQDALMFALYIVAIALGINMMDSPRSYDLGLFQVCFVAGFFALRVYVLFHRYQNSKK